MRLVVFLGLLGAGSSLRLTNPPPPRRAALARGVLAIAGAALVAPTVAPRPAAAAPVPDGCVWKGDGEYPGRASGMPVKEMNKNLDCASLPCPRDASHAPARRQRGLRQGLHGVGARLHAGRPRPRRRPRARPRKRLIRDPPEPALGRRPATVSPRAAVIAGQVVWELWAAGMTASTSPMSRSCSTASRTAAASTAPKSGNLLSKTTTGVVQIPWS